MNAITPVKNYTTREWALQLVAWGYGVFIIPKGMKHNDAMHWFHATRDPAVVNQWFDVDAEINIGVTAGESRFILDVDKDGLMQFDLWEVENGTIEGPRVRTPSGGLHIHMLAPYGIKSGKQLGDGFDCRGTTKHVAFGWYAGDAAEGKPAGHYTVISDDQPQMIPAWLLPKFGASNVCKAKSKEPIGELDKPLAIEGARQWLYSLPDLHEGQRDDELFNRACWLSERGLSEETVAEIIDEYNDEHVHPPFPEWREKVRSACSRTTPGSKRDLIFEHQVEVKNALPFGLTGEQSKRPPLIRNRRQQRQRSKPEWIVEGIIARGYTHLFKGLENGYKSFIVGGLCHAAAIERPWAASKIDPGFKAKKKATVVYFGFEGGDDFDRKRLPALDIAAGLSEDEAMNVPFFTADDLPEGTTIENFAVNVINAIWELGITPDIIVIDTLARLLGALVLKENDNDAANALAIAFDKIMAEFKCAIIFVAHLGAQGDRARGATAFEGNMAFRYLLKAEGPSVAIYNEKAKPYARWEKAVMMKSRKITFDIPAVDDAGNEQVEKVESLVFDRSDKTMDVVTGDHDALRRSLRLQEVKDALAGCTKPLSTHELAERIVCRKMLAETDLTLLEAMQNGDVDHAMVQAEIAALAADTKGTKGKAGSKPQKGLLADLLISGRADRPKTAQWFLRYQKRPQNDPTAGLPETVEGLTQQ